MAIYFLSDTHLGLNFRDALAAEREKKLVQWLSDIQNDCQELFLVGDIFDYWFEYKRVVPKGFVRLLGQLAAMADKGVKINFFAGNHDLWVGDYFAQELNAKVFTKPEIIDRQGLKLLVAHGDGLGKNDTAGRLLSATFRSKSARWLFQRLVHPDISMKFGQWWSRGNRNQRGNVTHTFKGIEEPLVQWATRQHNDIDLFVFGHLHNPNIVEIGQNRKVVILGEWIENPTVAVLENGAIRLERVLL